MCGRVHCTLDAAQVARACGLQDGDADSVRTVEMDRFLHSYNVSPGTYLPVFTMRRDVQGSQVQNPRGAIHCMKWGLVPSFTKRSEKPDHYRMFNARSESVKEKASFRRLIPHNRCLLAVEGFYEWRKDGSKKQPYYIHFKDGRPLVFAALYDSWENSEGEILHTFTILTTRSSSVLEWLHGCYDILRQQTSSRIFFTIYKSDRMPVIFGNKGTIDMWLSNSPLKLEVVLTPYADSDLVWYPVTSAMGKPSFGGPECIKEIPLKHAVQNPLSKLFSRKADDSTNKSSVFFSKSESPNCLKEEADMEDAKELVGKKRHESHDIPSAEKKTIWSEPRGIKRELEEMGPDFEVKSELPYSYSTTVKKKPQTGDKQSSLLSYFGRK